MKFTVTPHTFNKLVTLNENSEFIDLCRAYFTDECKFIMNIGMFDVIELNGKYILGTRLRTARPTGILRFVYYKPYMLKHSFKNNQKCATYKSRTVEIKIKNIGMKPDDIVSTRQICGFSRAACTKRMLMLYCIGNTQHKVRIRHLHQTDGRRKYIDVDTNRLLIVLTGNAITATLLDRTVNHSQ